MGMNPLEKLADLTNRALEAEAAWLRQILTVAGGALALLAGLGPEVPAEGSARDFLAATWVLLGFGIVTGSAATYAVVSRAKWIASAFRAELERPHAARIEKKDPPELAWAHLQLRMNPILQLCKPLMVFSLLAAVFCLTAYAMEITLAA